VPGPREDFAHVYSQHVGDVYGFFGYRIASRHEAEDLTQLTFERALRAWDGFDPRRATARTWLIAIARNLLVDHYRRDVPAPVGEVPDAEHPESACAQTGGENPANSPRLGVSPEVEAALSGLDDRERELIALRFGGDLNGPEIAELTGLTLANVQQIMSRSLRRMRAELAGGR
jgi:RNA polymerase sigma-70 factor (ECF subfamily)